MLKRIQLPFMILSKLGVTIPSFFIVQAPWLKTLLPKMITLKCNTPTLPGSWWQKTAATEICFSFFGRVRKISFAQHFKRGIKWIIYLGSYKSEGQTGRQNLKYNLEGWCWGWSQNLQMGPETFFWRFNYCFGINKGKRVQRSSTKEFWAN